MTYRIDMTDCSALLEKVDRGVSTYLDRRRAGCPRFFFLSDDELLGVLGISTDLHALRLYLPKLFNNVNDLELGTEGIQGIITNDGEKINLHQPLLVTGAVDDWLDDLIEMTHTAMRYSMRQALRAQFRQQRENWVLNWPIQAVHLANSINFTSKNVMTALQSGRPTQLKHLHRRILLQIENITKMMRTRLPLLYRLALTSVLVSDVHSRDVVRKILDEHPFGRAEAEWQSQMKMTLESEEVIHEHGL